ncbi:MAG: cobalamin-dependent protein [Ignavibacterium sp.]|nr:cobalamin-dependent protein [Ignavibacterium sp.]MCX7611572.1 cobalamin-dependent protein [Ignavibacterium sp.]MDW8376300.1 cobalamin-dependent protein [Ignavibacteriales bacterium]
MSEIKQSYYLDFYNNLIEGNKEKCSSLVNSLLEEGVDITDIYIELFQKSLYRIGKLWDNDELSISQEHLVTNIISYLIEKYSPAPITQRSEKAIVTCIDKEFHEIGAKMVSKIFEYNGYKTYYLGASIPSKDIVKFIRLIEPSIIAISWSLYLNLGRFLDVLDNVTKMFPNIKVYVGGQALSENSNQILKKYSNVRHISCVRELKKQLSLESV